jgi:hypothetical protein
MSKITTKINTLTGKLDFLKLSRFNKRHQPESVVFSNYSNEPNVKNWGKTAEYLPEVSENHLATSLFQFELERAKVTAVA